MVGKLAILFPLVIGILCGSLAPNAYATDTSAEAFAQLPVMTDAHLSPDGTHVAFLSSLQGSYSVVVERFKPDFERFILLPSEGSEFAWVRWATNDRLVVSASFSARRYLAETLETRLFSVGRYGENLTPIIRSERRKETGSRVAKDLPPPQIQDNVIDFLSDDPDHILVALDADHDTSIEVRRVDINDGSFKVEVTDFSGDSNWITDRSGFVRIGWRRDFDNDRVVVNLRDQAGYWEEFHDAEWLVAGFIPMAFSTDPNVIFAIGRNDEGMYVVKTVDLEAGTFIETVFENEHVDAEWLLYSDIDEQPVGVSYTRHFPGAEYFDDGFRRLQTSIDAALPDTINRIESTSTGQRQVLILAYSETNLGTYYVWDRDAGGLNEYSDHIPALNAGMLSPTEAVTYAARDGLQIPGYLTLPKGKGREGLATIVLPHGGPASRVSKQYWFISQFLAARGYAVFQPNFRGSSGYGLAFREAGEKEWGGKMQDDVTDGARWLVEEGIADPKRMCIVGWSYGGYAAAMGLVKTPELFSCGVSINGVLNLPRLIQDDKRYVGGTEWTKSIGLEGERSRTVSPYHQVQRIEAPILIIQAKDDARVHSDQGRGMAAQLKKHDKEFEYLEIEYGGHSMLNVDGRIRILQALDAFLAQHLGQ